MDGVTCAGVAGITRPTNNRMTGGDDDNVYLKIANRQLYL